MNREDTVEALGNAVGTDLADGWADQRLEAICQAHKYPYPSFNSICKENLTRLGIDEAEVIDWDGQNHIVD